MTRVDMERGFVFLFSFRVGCFRFRKDQSAEEEMTPAPPPSIHCRGGGGVSAHQPLAAPHLISEAP